MSLSVKTQGGSGGFFPSISVTGLAQTDTVYAAKDGKTVRGKWQPIPNPAVVVPYGYTQLEYIQTNGNSFIVGPEFSALTDAGFEFVAEYTYTGTNNKSMFRVNYCFGVFVQHSTLYLQKGGEEAASTASTYAGAKHTIKVTANSAAYIDGAQIGTIPTGDDYYTGNVGIFADNAGTNNIPYCKIYSLKLTRSDVVVNDLVPCLNPNGEIGLYDLMTNTFYDNSGAGALVAGAEVPATIDGFLISPLREFGMWTVTATDGTNTATQDVLVDVATEFEIEMALSA